jgi:hypothetical protein
MGFFEQTTFTLEEGDGAVAIVFDGLDLDLPATHDDGRKSKGVL